MADTVTPVPSPSAGDPAPVTPIGPDPLFTSDLTIPEQYTAWRLRAVNIARRERPGVRQRYVGPAYPFGATVGSVLGGKPDEAVVVTSIINILTTPKGTVPYDPLMGSEVPFLVFEILDEITVSLIRYFTFKDLTEQEPRIVVRTVVAERVDPHTVVVQVGYSLVGDPEGQVFGTPVTYNRETVGGI